MLSWIQASPTYASTMLSGVRREAPTKASMAPCAPSVSRAKLGTCGGFQHVVIEYARNVLGFADAQHAEYDPYASDLFITELACSLAGQEMAVKLSDDSRAAQSYGRTEAREQYYCNFGINPEHQRLLDDGGLRVVGVDGDGEARVLELPDHRFFIATLFVPQLRSSPESPHPLVTAYLRAAMQPADLRVDRAAQTPSA
jgi:CTP synthase (UTP-ammonia lyase)